ncbi:hypothetical protein A2368_03435 [Candidatus Collierbacteria bacterium RIFOXYB1_FULL_49_13]|uniref:ABC3 transporter permease C-terminal domain-containing protein n=1 Tax=Candidatus Collierbacteria bacterium RIFOXYB1_FULL_49_13 TaxID=1817728 RepID=A0A1F5FIJ3_9BACT|nr:MAG: hypothetical protein A2368_03435 [Candidatus Collierbacteria bacterium RIFOXYB1_FULL_49_13]
MLSNLWRKIKKFFIFLKVGFVLASRDIRRTSVWTTGLITFVMMLTFLNLIVVRGILVGLIEGSIIANRDRMLGDVFIDPLSNKKYVDDTQAMVDFIWSLPETEAVSVRYTAGGRAEADYKDKVQREDITDSAGVIVAGIDPVAEDKATRLSEWVVDGEYLTPEDSDMVMVGSNILYRYTPIEDETIKTAAVGSRIRLLIGGAEKEVIIKGVVRTKAGGVDSRVFINSSQLREILGKQDLDANEIAIVLKSGADADGFKQVLVNNRFDSAGNIRTGAEALPKFVLDIQQTFNILGNVIGGIGLVVASITIFIVIFVNAITRRKYIGILKGIGVSGRAIELSYIIQSVVYAGGGIMAGMMVIYGLIKPYFDKNPIDFPFSDGILVADIPGVMLRAMVLFVATMIAGYIPARIVVKQNTLDAILGR